MKLVLEKSLKMILIILVQIYYVYCDFFLFIYFLLQSYYSVLVAI